MESDEQGLKRWLRAQVDVPPAGVVVDLGCGGADDIAVLARSHPGVAFLGVDRFTPKATGDKLGVPANLCLVKADISQGIPLKSESVHVVLSTNVLECLADQTAFLGECARVLRPMGQIVIAHFDWDTQTFDGPDRPLVRKMLHAFSDLKQAWMDAVDPWAGRRLRSLFAASREFTGDIRAYTLVSTNFAADSYGRRQAESFAGLVGRGLVSRQEYEAFMRFQTEAAASGAFMFSVTMFAFVGRKRTD